MTVTETSSPGAPATSLPRGVRLAIAAVLGLVAPILTGMAVLGVVAAATISRATVIRGADGVSIVEWAAPLAVWQWAIAGVIEFTLIAAVATAWWAALMVWRGQFVAGQVSASARRSAYGAGFAMIAATLLALLAHIRNWREWHTLIAQHPEWSEDPQAWQIPAGVALVTLIVGGVVAAMVVLRRRASVG